MYHYRSPYPVRNQRWFGFGLPFLGGLLGGFIGGALLYPRPFYGYPRPFYGYPPPPPFYGYPGYGYPYY